VFASDCASFANSVATGPADEAPYVFGSCPDLVGGTIAATSLAGGGLQIFMNNSGSGDITVETNTAGSVTNVLMAFNPINESFGCAATACAGVTVSAPDAAGNRTVTFANAVMNIVEPDQFPTGARTASANGSFVVPPPAPTATASRASRRP
jgi:hypothetical protein